MGYNTSYELQWEADEHDAAIGELIEADPDASYAINKDGSSEESCKWRKHEFFMRDLSLKFPEVLFTLDGTGEEPGDIWRKYFLDGKMQEEKAEVKIAAFDPKRLK